MVSKDLLKGAWLGFDGTLVEDLPWPVPSAHPPTQAPKYKPLGSRAARLQNQAPFQFLHIYIYMHTYVCICVRVYIYIYTYLSMCMNICCVCMHGCMYV